MRLNNRVLSIFHGLRIAASISLKMEIHLSVSFSAKVINPKLGCFGVLGFLGFAGFWTYSVDGTVFPFAFFLFFGFFGFYYEGKMSGIHYYAFPCIGFGDFPL